MRILAEFLEPLAHFRREKIRDTVVFFGSARVRRKMARWATTIAKRATLARLLTEWSDQFTNSTYRFVVCSGGGPGIMEAANRGAADAGGKTIGLNIGLPFEQCPNPYITPGAELRVSLLLHAQVLVRLSGEGAGGLSGRLRHLDELMEVLTLAQTQKLARRSPSCSTVRRTGRRSSTSTRW